MIMDLNNVISSIPNVVGSLYENIFVVSRNLGIYYEVQYNGEQLKISAPKTYDELIEYSDTYKDDLVSVIENNDSLKEVFVNKDNQEKLISVVTKDQYKLVFVMDISKIRVDSGERKLLIIADDSPVITKFFKKTLLLHIPFLYITRYKEL